MSNEIGTGMFEGLKVGRVQVESFKHVPSNGIISTAIITFINHFVKARMYGKTKFYCKSIVQP
jgi:hypothetical protein